MTASTIGTAETGDDASEEASPPYALHAPTNNVVAATQPNVVPNAEASSSTQKPSKSQTDTPNKSIVTRTQAYQINDFLAFAKRQGDNELGRMKFAYDHAAETSSTDTRS